MANERPRNDRPTTERPRVEAPPFQAPPQPVSPDRVTNSETAFSHREHQPVRVTFSHREKPVR